MLIEEIDGRKFDLSEAFLEIRITGFDEDEDEEVDDYVTSIVREPRLIKFFMTWLLHLAGELDLLRNPNRRFYMQNEHRTQLKNVLKSVLTLRNYKSDNHFWLNTDTEVSAPKGAAFRHRVFADYEVISENLYRDMSVALVGRKIKEIKEVEKDE